jgi:hypothetical protein
MGFNLSGMARGFGQATEDAGMKAMQAAILESIEEKRNQYATARDDKMIAHQSGENALNREHQTAIEQGRQEHSERLQDRGFTHAEDLQQQGFTHSENLQETSLEAAAKRQAELLAHQSGEGDKNRALTTSEGDKNRAVQRAGQGISAGHLALEKEKLGVLKKGAELDNEVKQIQVNNAKRVGDLQEEFKTASPERQKALREEIHVLTGKDSNKYLPVPLKDDTGATIGYQIFDTERREFVKQAGAAGSGSGVDWSQFLGGPKQPGSTSSAAPSRAVQASAPLIQEPPGSNRPGREDGLAARKRREIEDQKRRDQSRRDEYGDSGF